MMKLRKDDHIPLTVLLHIFSYQHNLLHCLISKELANFGRDNCLIKSKSKLPVTLILSSDILMEIFKDLLIRKMKEVPKSLGLPKTWVYPNIILVAARDNNLKAIVWLENNILSSRGEKLRLIWPEGISIMSIAARNGNLEMMQWLKEKECPKDSDTFSGAARGCHIQVLDWLQIIYGWPDAGEDAVDRTCDAIASTGRLDILKWALDMDCPWDESCANICASGGHMEMFHWIMSNRELFEINESRLVNDAALGGHLELLQWAIKEYGLKWNVFTFGWAVRSGNFELMKWARNNECPWDARTCTAAARLGRLDVLEWARRENCPWDAQTCTAAAEKGHLHVLEWARSRESPCPWDGSTCAGAARWGHLHILQWARARGCPWDERTCERAATRGRLEILQWARENGCPWDEETTRIAAQLERLDLLAWAMDHGCPIQIDECMTILFRRCGNRKNSTYPCASCFRDIWKGDLLNYDKWMCPPGCPMSSQGCLDAANTNRWEILMYWAACKTTMPTNLVVEED
jgi:hypothetical protein